MRSCQENDRPPAKSTTAHAHEYNIEPVSPFLTPFPLFPARLLGGDVVYAPRPAAGGGGSVFTATLRASAVTEGEGDHV